MILIFKKGFTKIVKGVQCDVKRISMQQIDEHLAAGWKRTIEEISEKPVKPKRKRRTKVEIEAEKRINKES